VQEFRNGDWRMDSDGFDDGEEEWMICVKHPLREFRLKAVDRHQHRLWFDTLKRFCINVKGGDDGCNEVSG